MRSICGLYIAVFLAGCASTPMTDAEATMVPAERVIEPAMLVAQPGTGQVTIKRERDLSGAPCAKRIFVDAKPIADLRIGEKVVIFLLPGDHVFGVLPLSFCGGDLVEVSGTVKVDKPIAFRMGVSATAGFFFNPTAF